MWVRPHLGDIVSIESGNIHSKILIQHFRLLKVTIIFSYPALRVSRVKIKKSK
jgi:hypothetical protein